MVARRVRASWSEWGKPLAFFDLPNSAGFPAVPVKCKVLFLVDVPYTLSAAPFCRQPGGGATQREEPPRLVFLQAGRVVFSRRTDSQVRRAFEVSAGKTWNRVHFVNCRVRCLLSPSTGPAPERPAGETPEPGRAFRLVLINDTIKPCVWKNSVASEMKRLHLYNFKEH